MKVHNLSIDSSQRGISVIASNTYYDQNGTYIIDHYSNTYSNPNDYVITLENPIYDVSEIKLVSARIPTPQLTVCSTNNTFSVDGQTISLENADYPTGDDLATHLQNELAPPVSNVNDVSFDVDTKRFTFSNTTPGEHNFTFEFNTGVNGYVHNSSIVTTPHQILGFGSNEYSSTSNVLTSGAINLVGPNSLLLRLSSGSDEFTQGVYTSTPFYTGHILLDGSDFINFNGVDDHLIHHFHSGPQKMIKDIRVEFFYMSHGRLIPYDFMEQEHILKIEMKGSMDKLENLPKVPVDVVEEKPVHIPEKVRENVYRWKKEYIYIALIVIVGVLLLLFMNKKPRRISGSPQTPAGQAS
jgi:hypothetical protein